MAEGRVSIRVRADDRLYDRIQAVCEQLGVQPADFVEAAIERELRRREVQLLQEEIAMEEISRNVLSTGQSLELSTEEEAADADTRTCPLCLKRVSVPAQEVQGPYLCEDCLALARGADLRRLETDL